MTAGNTKIYLNGRFVSEQDATVSVFDRCFLYGDGIFEGIAVWGRAPFRLEAHLDRMKDGLDCLRIPNPHDDDGWTALIERTIVEISRGEGMSSIKWEPRLLRKPEPNVTIIPIVGFKDYYKGLIAEKVETGLRAVMLSRPRVPSAALPAGTKHCNYLNSVLGAIEVTSSQADIGIAVDREGFVTEGIAYNVFAVKSGRVITAPLHRDLLPGITRAVVIEIARAEGYEIVEELFDAFTLASADEVFICSTLELAVPVIEIAGRKIGSGKPGPVSKKFGKLLIETMEREARDWHAARGKSRKTA
jgi:branched-chain amino acid aminotransferase